MTARGLLLSVLVAASVTAGQSLLGVHGQAVIHAFLTSVVGTAAALAAVRRNRIAAANAPEQVLSAPLNGGLAAAAAAFLAGSVLLLASLLLLSLGWLFVEGTDLLQLAVLVLVQSVLSGLIGGLVGFASWLR